MPFSLHERNLHLIPAEGDPLTATVHDDLLILRVGTACAHLPGQGRELLTGLGALTPGSNVLYELCERLFKQMTDSWVSLRSTLSDHYMSFEDTPISRYPALAQRYYGEWSARRSALATVICLVIGTGNMEDYQRACQVVDEWTQRKLLGFQVRDALHQLQRTHLEAARPQTP